MTSRWAVLLIVAVLGVTGAVAVAEAGPSADRLHLDPNRASVTASVEIGDGRLSFDVRGVEAHAAVTASVQRLACAQSGYGRLAAGTALADGSGRARWSSPIRLTPALRDGWHVIAIGAQGRTVACASIPASRPTLEPVRRHWGIWSFSRYFD